jgi:hypothetical protein
MTILTQSIRSLQKKLGEIEVARVAALKERDEALQRCNALNRRLTKAEGIIAASGIAEDRPKTGSGGLGRALANYAADQYKRERDQWRECAEGLARLLRQRIDHDDDVFLDWEADQLAAFDRLKKEAA